MEVAEQIDIFENFSQEYYNEIMQQESKIVKIDFSTFSSFNLELSQELLSNPEEVMRAGEIALEEKYNKGVLSPLSTLSNKLNKVNKVNIQNTTNYEYPSFCISQKLIVLYILYVADDVTHKDLEKILNKTTQAMSMILKRLKDEGFVNLTLSKQEVNSNTYLLTEKGKQYIENIYLDSQQRTKEQEQKEEYVIRFFNLPKSCEVTISQLRTKHLNKFITISGRLLQKTDVRPQVTSARFECPNCGNTLTVLQLDSKFKEPISCGCGRKGKFRILDKAMINAQKIVLEEFQEDIKGNEQPSRIDILLKKDLCEHNISFGEKIRIVGILKEVPILAKDGGKLTRFDLMLEANNIELVEETIVKLSEQDIIEIRRFKDKHQEKTLNELEKKFAKNYAGNVDFKKALLLQAVSNETVDYALNGIKRLTLNLANYGIVGTAKTQMSKQTIRELYSRSEYCDTHRVSTVGLTASVSRDEFLKCDILKAGAVIIAGDGLCVIDELDKIEPKDSSAIAEPMESHTVSVHKKGINRTLKANAKILIQGNFKQGADETIITSTTMNVFPNIYDRLDLIFRAEKVNIDSLAEKILSNDKSLQESDPFLKKYIYMSSKHKISYDLSKELQQAIKLFCNQIIKETENSALIVGARFMESIKRICFASAKLRINDCVDKEDLAITFSLVRSSLEQRGFIKTRVKEEIINEDEFIKLSDKDITWSMCGYCGNFKDITYKNTNGNFTCSYCAGHKD